MTKKRLLQILQSLPEETSITVAFSFGKSYDPEAATPITGINMIENEDKTLTAVICSKERAQEKAA